MDATKVFFKISFFTKMSNIFFFIISSLQAELAQNLLSILEQQDSEYLAQNPETAALLAEPTAGKG